ncbi:MAG: radical SAM protein, partial [Syntrophobacteraceae bacterium]|nr:radical SAM protein [Syntrophobacteraceae bacterium]
MILLVTAPVVKPSEPPPGISRILGAMRAHGVGCAAWDANLECLLGLLHGGNHSGDRWTARAVRNVDRNLKNIQAPKGLLNLDRYKRSVSDLNRLLEGPWNNGAVHVSLTNYQDAGLSPVKSGDLLAAAERPEGNLFYPLFSKSLGELLKVHGPSVVGFSLNYLSQALTTFAMMGFLRRTEPSLTLALGGGLVTSWMRGPGWKNPFSGLVDLMIPGSGETPLLSLAKGEKRDILPFTHDYSPFPMSDYLSPGVVIPYSASSGCYWNRCGFCPERAEKNPYVPLHPHRVKVELRELVEANSPALIHLLDNAISPALLESLAVHPPGVP